MIGGSFALTGIVIAAIGGLLLGGFYELRLWRASRRRRAWRLDDRAMITRAGIRAVQQQQGGRNHGS